jgi:hypothetical protein
VWLACWVGRREDQVAANESAFRAINERIAEGADTGERLVEFLCECDRLDCAQRLEVVLEDYEAVRARGECFIVEQGHERLEFEVVVEERSGYLVVAKIGEVGETAVAADPRD